VAPSPQSPFGVDPTADCEGEENRPAIPPPLNASSSNRHGMTLLLLLLLDCRLLDCGSLQRYGIYGIHHLIKIPQRNNGFSFFKLAS
jgi:hypothetical protein